MICVPRRATGWKHLKAIVVGSVLFESTSNGASVSAGRPMGPKPLKSRIITKEATMARLRTHPGEVLQEEYLVPLDLSARALAKELDVPPNRLTEIMRGTRDVTADTAIRLGRYFGTDPRFWLNLQAAYDLSKAEKAHSYKKIVPRTAA
jgi:addiction module HigA family antidote